MDSPASTRERYHHGALAATMVEHALTMVSDQGVERVSLRSIAQAPRVSPSATYDHFHDKEALLRAVGERGYALLGERMTLALASHPGDTDHDTLNDLDRRRLLRPGIRTGLDMTIWAATHGMACLLVEGVIPPKRPRRSSTP
jgi:AcrR family transcriptional regulator